MRLQLALNVSDLEASIEFYEKMFDTKVAKVRPGYANFAIDQPPLKLVLFEGGGEGGSINHLGVEVETAEQVEAAEARMTARGMVTTGVDDTLCCYAAKTETWIESPDNRWEWYVKTGDAEQLENEIVAPEGVACCAPEALKASPVESVPGGAITAPVGQSCC